MKHSKTTPVELALELKNDFDKENGRMKHTKGPWNIRYQFNNPKSYPTAIVSEHSPTLRESINALEPDADSKLDICKFNFHAREFTLANAHLIAAAPDLLEALKEAWAQMDTSFLNAKTIEMIKQAIAKAEGK